MVKIIDELLDPEMAKRVSCHTCGAKLEYYPIDVKERHGTDYGGGPDGETWIDCPKCGKKVILTSW
jgi:predicted RNA-binding Zn-ribbon protein involved in translation (DUF1610 family)